MGVTAMTAMIAKTSKDLRAAVVLLAWATLGCGLVYPLAVTGCAAVLLPNQAAGSAVTVNGTVVGSALVGQPFSGPGLFHGRPSATAKPYDAMNSLGSNLGPKNPALASTVADRVTAVAGATGALVPVDLVTASGSGLDPDISVAGARYQVPRVARELGVDEAAVLAIVNATIEDRWLGIFGEPRVNVLRLNIALSALRATAPTATAPAATE